MNFPSCLDSCAGQLAGDGRTKSAMAIDRFRRQLRDATLATNHPGDKLATGSNAWPWLGGQALRGR